MYHCQDRLSIIQREDTYVILYKTEKRLKKLSNKMYSEGAVHIDPNRAGIVRRLDSLKEFWTQEHMTSQKV